MNHPNNIIDPSSVKCLHYHTTTNPLGQVLQSGRSCSMAYRDLLEYLCESLSGPGSDSGKLKDHSMKIADCVSSLIGCAEVSSVCGKLCYRDVLTWRAHMRVRGDV